MVSQKQKPDPTLKDVYTKLGQQDEQLNAIHTQVKKTNGRVTILEQKQRDADVIADYLLKHPAATSEEVKEGWSTREKQLIAFITALLAIITGLISLGKI